MSFSHNAFLASPGLNWLAACQQLEQRGEATASQRLSLMLVPCRVPAVPRW